MRKKLNTDLAIKHTSVSIDSVYNRPVTGRYRYQRFNLFLASKTLSLTALALMLERSDRKASSLSVRGCIQSLILVDLAIPSRRRDQS